MPGTPIHWYWETMAWVCISKTSQPPCVGSSTPSSLTWVQAVCLFNPLNYFSRFPLPPFLWDQAALRRTWADLKEGKRAKFMRRITLAEKKRPTESDKMQRLGLALSERGNFDSKSCLGRLGYYQQRDPASKGSCEVSLQVKEIRHLNPKQGIKSSNVT